MSVDLRAKHAFITGAAGGIGRAVTAAFIEAGAHVTAADINEEGLAALENSLASGGQLTTCVLDISDQTACAAVIEAVAGVDILINNGAVGMGVIRDDHLDNLVAMEEIVPAVWDRFVATNLSGAWYLTRAVVPAMKALGWGRIITVTTSMFTMLRPKFHPYGPVKAGLEAMAAGHAGEFAKDGITVNVVVPGGPTDTPFVPAVTKMDRSAMIRPEVMAPPMLWLCSDAAAEVTGNRYIAASWDPDAPVAEARAAAEAPIGWPGLAGAPVWPGGNPDT